MSFVHRIRRFACHVLRRRRDEAEMVEEMRFHLEQRAQDYVASGVSAEDARYAARRKFGNVGRIQEEARDALGVTLVDRATKTIRYAVRQLVKSPGFAALAVATLALGVGVNTAMFSVLNEVMLRPLPYPDRGRIDRFDRATAQNPVGRMSPADFADFQREAAGYGEVAGYLFQNTSLSEPGQPAEMVNALRITPNLFALLRMPPLVGRTFRPEEAVKGNDRVAILSERCWQGRYGGRRDILGQSIRIDGESHVVVGVMPAALDDWRHLGGFDVFRPMAFDRATAMDRRFSSVRMIGRRADGLTHEQAAAFVARFAAHLAADHPDVDAGSTWRLNPLQHAVVPSAAMLMVPMLIGLSGFVLLIACSNLANLILARTIARAREFAVRAALGASRSQLLQPLVAESLLLALTGGLCAIAVARWTTDYLSYRFTDETGSVTFALDWHVLAWAMLASVTTAFAFGLAPALFALRLNVNDTLKSGGRGGTGDRRHQRFRHLLIVGQFALAMVLLGGAALFVRALQELNERRGGWTSDNLVTGKMVLPTAGYPDDARVAAFERIVQTRLEAIPGVASASLAGNKPFLRWTDVRKYIVEGKEPPAPGREPAALVNNVSPRYFETAGTALIKGRSFTDADNKASVPVMIIGQSMATALFGPANPLGHRLAQAGGGPPSWIEIVGVAADVKPVVADPMPVPFQVYLPLAQYPDRAVELLLRTTVSPSSAFLDSVRAAISGLDADVPVRRVMTADAAIARENSTLGAIREILGGLSVIGLMLASLGIYGVIACTMAQRTSEFAIRLALGACVRDISRLVLTSGVKLALFGAGLGLVGVVAVFHALAGAFPGMRFDNPSMLVAMAILLVAVALLASWLPARRATQVDPMLALRAE